MNKLGINKKKRSFSPTGITLPVIPDNFIPIQSDDQLLSPANILKKKRAEPPPGDNWIHASDAGVMYHGSTGAIYTNPKEVSAIITDNLKEKKQKSGKYLSTEQNLIIDYDDGNAYRPINPECRIQFSFSPEGKTLTIDQFICPGGGKELLRDTIIELQKNKSFNLIELTPANLASKVLPTSQEKIQEMKNQGYIDQNGKFTEMYHNAMLKKVKENYNTMGFQDSDDEKMEGTPSLILSILQDYVRPAKGGSIRHRSKKYKKRRKSIKKNNFFEMKRKTKRRRTQRKRK